MEEGMEYELYMLLWGRGTVEHNKRQESLWVKTTLNQPEK